MKLELNENAKNVLGFLILGCVALGGFTSCTNYYHKRNTLVSKADTCEKAAIIDGVFSERALILCKFGKVTKD